MDEAQAKLIAEQIGRMRDSLTARLDAIEERQKHQQALDAEQIKALRSSIDDLREVGRDHENRLRQNSAGVTQLQTWSGMVGGGSGLLSIIAFVKALLFP